MTKNSPEFFSTPLKLYTCDMDFLDKLGRRRFFVYAFTEEQATEAFEALVRRKYDEHLRLAARTESK